MRALFLLSLTIVIGFSSCNKNDDKNSITCNTVIVLDKDLYDTVNTQNHVILSAIIFIDCLEVEVYSGGCDGNSWEVSLVDSELVAESSFVERFLKISLKNEEVCLAMIAKKYTFDLKPIRLPGNQILLNLGNWDAQLLYSY